MQHSNGSPIDTSQLLKGVLDLAVLAVLADHDVASYASAVRAALGALPDTERESLLEDLENHLAEVASESGLSLQERLGKPEDYAAELRSAYGAGNDASSSGRHGSLRDRAG